MGDAFLSQCSFKPHRILVNNNRVILTGQDERGRHVVGNIQLHGEFVFEALRIGVPPKIERTPALRCVRCTPLVTEEALPAPFVGYVVLHGDDRVNRHYEVRAQAFLCLNPEFGKLVVRGSEFARHRDQMPARAVADCADFIFVDVEFACMLTDIDDCHLNVFQLVGIVVAVVGDTVAQNKGRDSVRRKPAGRGKAFMAHSQMMITSTRTDDDGCCRSYRIRKTVMINAVEFGITVIAVVPLCHYRACPANLRRAIVQNRVPFLRLHFGNAVPQVDFLLVVFCKNGHNKKKRNQSKKNRTAKKWYKKGTSYTKNKDDSFLLCEKSVARVEQKGTMLANSSTSKQKPVKEEKQIKVTETPKPKQDVAVVEKPKQQVEQKVEQKPVTPKKEIYSVDASIPSNSRKAEHTYVLIIANENYQDVEDVQYALNDGRIFKEYCEKTLGIPTSNIRLKEDATLNNIISGVDWLKSICEASNGKGKCIVYYSGHGIPDESTQSSYILPVDGSGKNVRTGYSLNELYSTLSDLPVESATMFIDACFSGANRGNNMLVAARGVAIKAKPEAPKGKLVVFSAAQSDETAYPYEEAKHGMFTYFLLRKLKETKGDCSLSELSDYLKENVVRTALLENDKPQTPAISVSPMMESVWRNLKLK